MGSKITIIGAGSVGATIAYTLSQEDYVSEILIIDVLKDKVDGEAMDIAQGTAFRDPIDVYSGNYEDAVGSDIVIITSGIARKPGQSRIELAQTNVNIIKSIAPQLKKYCPDALFIIVANPVDIMTYAFIKVSGIPEQQVIGSGTLLDTARLRYGLSKHFDVAQKNIHAYIFGEHGDTSFVPWSISNIASVPVKEYSQFIEQKDENMPAFDEEVITNYVRKSGGEIIKRKGATFYGVTVAVVNLVSMLNAASESITTVSTMMHGEYGVDDVCTSCLTIVGPKGVKGKLPVKLEPEEIEKFQASANALKAVIADLDLSC
ncbi:MAG: L-lactate dehydrogenase [Lachnospiraceae bacterium]|nr:L-lactate dehydrogenase [Lachnospiraceae bacterium]